MPVVDVMNLEGKTVGKLDLADDVFGAKVNSHLLHEAVRHHLASERAGTHKTKDKSEVSGSGKKLWKQKGTGRARIGSIRSPLWRHGGTVHGPVPRSYEYDLPRKMILGALRSALSAKAAQRKLTVVDGWAIDSHKTKPFRQALSKIDNDSRTILLVETNANVNLERASRNLEGVTLVAPAALKPYDLLRHERLVLSREAAVKLSRALSSIKVGMADLTEPAELAPPAKSEPAAKGASPSKTKAKVARKPAPEKAKKKSAPKARGKSTPEKG